jgi:LPXTG-motif cell wall-anchored protein
MLHSGNACFAHSQEDIGMKIVKTLLAVFTLALLGAMLATGARGDNWNKKTVMTFDQPIEIPGQILPAGTYTFQLVESKSDRNIVRIFQADGTTVVATILAINNYRLHATDKTAVKFAERSGDNPEALKAWFYPGDNFGQEFVYPRQRAIELAAAEKEPVPALAVETTELTTAPIVAVTPEAKEEPVAQAIQINPEVAEVTPVPTPAPAIVAADPQLPKTGSQVPLIALLGLTSLGVAFTLKRFVR